MKPGLYYADGEQWGPLPAWARFFIAVGAYAAERPLGAERLVLGVSVPAREYSAAFAAFGVIRARSSLSADSESPEEHLQRLCSFGDGTRLFYFSDNRKWEGIFRGCEVVEGETFIKVQLESTRAGGKTKYLPLRDAVNIHVAEKLVTLPDHQRGRPIVSGQEEFLHAILKTDVRTFVRFSRLECALVGPKGRLHSEIGETRLTVYPNLSEAETGTLQEVLRVRQFFDDETPYRSEVFAADSGKQPEPANDTVPHVVVFDGARGFMKWRTLFLKSHWIVLLDRTDPQFRDAADTLSDEFRSRRVDDGEPIEIPLPDGVEVIGFRERTG